MTTPRKHLACFRSFVAARHMFQSFLQILISEPARSLALRLHVSLTDRILIGEEMYASEVAKKFGLDLSRVSNEGKLEKRFDFVFVGALGTVFVCECNFYGSSGSKLNETAGRYKLLALESKEITGLQFVWFTDGIGWNTAKHNLEETFDVLDNLYNLQDLENGAIESLVDSTSYLNKLLTK